VLRRRPGISRAAVAQELGLTSGLAAEVVGRLRAARLVAETPAPPQGRGRPSTVLLAHPEGPVVLAADLRLEDWRWAIAGADGTLRRRSVHRHAARDPAAVLGAVRDVVRQVRREYGARLRAVGLAATATVHDGRLVQASTLGWGPVDASVVTAGTGVPLLIGNDATLAGMAEARTGAATGAGTALHLLVGVGVGGTLTVGGQPATGAHGAAGEYGHLPFGDRTLACPCGARGCWDLEVDGRAMARHLGVAQPADPQDFARAVLARADAPAADAISRVAVALGGGVAGLVNLHDPDAVTLGGLARPLRHAGRAAFDEAYASGLMAFHRVAPPPVLDAAHGDDGPLAGAALLGLDAATDEAGLAAWAAGAAATQRS
jgi:predicted NBD/HSP70 family sugar kinase